MKKAVPVCVQASLWFFISVQKGNVPLWTSDKIHKGTFNS